MAKKNRPSGCSFAKWITRNGVRLYAKDYGYKAWPIPNTRKSR